MPDARLRRTRALYDARPDPGPLTDAELMAVFRERYIAPLTSLTPSSVDPFPVELEGMAIMIDGREHVLHRVSLDEQ